MKRIDVSEVKIKSLQTQISSLKIKQRETNPENTIVKINELAHRVMNIVIYNIIEST